METDIFLITLFRMLQKQNLRFFDTMDGNVLALGAVADFGAQNCQYTTNVDAR
jgi:hypothetical protein